MYSAGYISIFLLISQIINSNNQNLIKLIIMKNINKFFLPLLFTIIFVQNSFGWGQKGHDIVADIAENHLTRKSRKIVNDLLDGKSMLYWSNWLDNASHTPEYAHTKTWHYKNVDQGYTYETMKAEPNGDVVTAIKEQIEILKSKESFKEQKQLALKMLIHLVGDLHQPMHMGHLSDLGGNKWTVTHFNRTTNLHSLWDTPMIESGHSWSHTEWTEELDRLNQTEVNSICSGSIDDWAKQTLAIATDIYLSTPQNSRLSYDYHAKWTPIVEQQLLRGGLRLAYILNQVF